MASTQIQTTNNHRGPFPASHSVARAGARLWAIVNGGTSGSDAGVNLWYSDNDGGSWAKHADLDTADLAGVSIDCAQDPDTSVWELHCCWSGGDGVPAGAALKHANILSNVDTGVPGTVTTTTVDAGGTDLGVWWGSLFLTPTSTNPRVWIVAAKQTATSTIEMRAWYGAMGTITPGFSTTNFTNLDSTSSSGTNTASRGGVGAHWTVSAAEKATIIVKKKGTPGLFRGFTFDPTAATPTPGTAITVATMDSGTDWGSQEQSGPLIALNAKADYAVFAHHHRTAGTVQFYKSVNGTSWTQPTGWASLTLGRLSIASNGTDLWIVHAATFGDSATTAQALKYRQITTSSDTMGGVNDFSDTNGQGVSVLRHTGTSKLYASYRAGTASLYPVRSDFVSIGGAADTTPPGTASFTATANTAGARIDLSATMPTDTDVAEYEIRRLTTGYPASGRTDGTVIVAPTASSANAVVTFSDTGLTNGTRYFYRIFVKDTSANWNTGTTATAVAATRPAFLTRRNIDLTAVADGVTPAGNNPIAEYQLATANHEGGKVSHYRYRSGNDQADPPTQTVTDLVSTGGGSTFRYEDPADSGTYVNVPAGGLATTFHGRRLRVYTTETASSRWFSLRVEQ